MADKDKIYRKYSKEDLNRAIEAVKNGTSCASAAKQYKIPRVTLMYKVSGKFPVDCKSGVGTILSKNEEDILRDWIVDVAKTGFPVTKTQLLDSVAMLVKKLKRENNFTNGRPGRHWFEGFLQRHPEISQRMTQNLTVSRAAVSELSIRTWFDEVKQYFSANQIEITDPRQIFNADETAFFLSPKANKVLAKKGAKTIYSYSNANDKECITTLLLGNAAGELAPPMIVFDYERVPKSVVLKCPHPDWAIGRSDAGWMTGESFFEYISNNFYKWLLENKVPFPIILYVDGHRSHLTYSLSCFCSEKNIILVSLLPNSTHILQPMDVGVFHPLKSEWRNEIHRWRLENKKRSLKKEDFAPLLDKVLQKTILSGKNQILQNAFRTCGLYPFNADAVDYSKVLKTTNPLETPELQNTEPQKLQQTATGLKGAINILESFLDENLLKEFRENKKSSEWNGRVEDTSLFFVWKKLNEENDGDRNQPEDSEDTNPVIIELGDGVVVEDIDWQNVTVDLPECEENINSKKMNEHDELPGEEAIISDIEMIANNSMVCGDSKKVDSRENFGLINIEQSLEDEKHKEADIQNKDDKFKTGSVEELEDNITEANKENDKNIFESNKKISNKCNGDVEGWTAPDDLGKNIEKMAMDNAPKSDNNVPLIPSPFKSILFWPEKSTTKKPNRIREKIPSVCSSDKWKEYYLKKENEKNEKERAILERKRKREEKKQELQKTKESKRENKKLCRSGARSGAVEEVKRNIFASKVEEKTEAKKEVTSTVTSNKIGIGDHVIVNYEGEKFPGRVSKISNYNKFFVSAMVMSGINNWKWPNVPDELWYNLEDINEKINVPTPVNTRGIFSVPEIEKYRRFLMS